MVNRTTRNVIKTPGAFLGNDLIKRLNFTRLFCSNAGLVTQSCILILITDMILMVIEEITNHFHLNKYIHKLIFQIYRLFEAYIELGSTCYLNPWVPRKSFNIFPLSYHQSWDTQHRALSKQAPDSSGPLSWLPIEKEKKRRSEGTGEEKPHLREEEIESKTQ